MTKTSKAAPKKANPTVESVLERLIGTLDRSAEAIDDEIRAIQDGEGGESKFDDGARIAFLAAKAGAIADTLRKIEAARAKRVEKLSRALVVAYLRQLEASERAQVIREATSGDQKGNVLG